MKINNLESLSAAEIGKLVNDRIIAPSTVVKYFSERIKKFNPQINAFVYTKIDEALEQAKILENRLKNGENLGPFAGVPFALKDFLPSKKGWTHSHGGVKSLIKQDEYDSMFCKAMEEAGGIAIGKTNSPAYGFRGLCDNKLYGPTCNPFNIKYNSGGSSGGSAAAVAGGLIPIAEGGDAGGSIRIPAAWCNCYGYKASIGTIPSVCRPDAWAATHPFCFNGGLTKTVEDAAILLNHMAKYDPRDPFSRYLGDVDFTKEMNKSIKGLKIAFTPDFDIFSVDKEVADKVFEAAKKLEQAGAKVDLVHFNIKYTAKEIAEAWCKSICLDTAIELELDKQNGFDIIKDHRDELPEEFIYWNEKVANSNMIDYYKINLIRTNLLDAQQDIFDNYDIIISPTTACLPVLNSDDKNTLGPAKINNVDVEQLIGFTETFIFNFTGNPAASIPVGLSKNKLPIGMQIVGKRFNDSDVLAVSKTFENICPWRDNYKLSYCIYE